MMFVLIIVVIIRDLLLRIGGRGLCTVTIIKLFYHVQSGEHFGAPEILGAK